MKQQIQQYFAGIIKDMGVDNAGIVVVTPENPAHGDYTTNIAMLLAGRLKGPPMKIVQQIVDRVKTDQNNSLIQWLERVEIAPPGFINLFVTEASLGAEVSEVLSQKDRYGATRYTGITSETDTKSKRKVARDKGQVTTKTAELSVPVLSGTKKQKNAHSNAPGAEKTDNFRNSASFGNPLTQVRVMVEFAHPNTHKAFHIGHLRNITTGESVVRLLESQGNRVIRANYQGDVGMHIAKALYALLNVSPFKDEVLTVVGIKNRVEFLGKAYAAGSNAFEEDEIAKQQIVDLNALVYASAQQYAKEVGRNPGTTDYLALVKNQQYQLEAVYALWKETRQWSLDYFDTIYKRVYTHYDRFYFESECLSGVDTAKDGVKKGVLKESEGAIIFDGKPHGIDTRVFVNSLGLPTYEAKELALAPMEVSEHGELAKIIHCVGPEQASFFTVTFKAEELLGIVKPGVQYHLTYGWVKLKEGKMSSRTGNVVLGEWLIDEVKKAIIGIIESNDKQRDIDKEHVSEALAVAAIKYAFLKVSTKQEIAFDLKESINTNGDSGPYLMYAYARCQSVLRKFQNSNLNDQQREKNVHSLLSSGHWVLNSEERMVARLIMQYPDIVKSAADNFAPNTLCTYLFGLAQQFNLLYAKEAIIGNDVRLALTAATAQLLKNGLNLLGIETLERM